MWKKNSNDANNILKLRMFNIIQNKKSKLYNLTLLKLLRKYENLFAHSRRTTITVEFTEDTKVKNSDSLSSATEKIKLIYT